jgi:transposase
MANLILGIDVAKRKLDVALLGHGQTLTRQFDNSLAGFQALQAWLTSLHQAPLHACLEATGSYGDDLAHFLYQAGHRVSLVNPARIKGYAQAKMQRNKTDKADARLIADFCRTQQPPLWAPPTPAVGELQALTRRLEVLEEMLQAEKNRLAVSPLKTQASIQRMIHALEQEIAELEASINDHLDQNPDLKAQQELLESIPGIGEKTARLLLSEIDFSRYESARQVAAFAGVTPKKKESGSSLKQTNLSKLGQGRIRKGLYFPAIVAKQHNQIVKEFAKRLATNGKTPMQIVCAAIRKLLHIAFGVLKHKKPFDPSLAFSG